MPILSPEPSCYPDDLFDGGGAGQHEDRRWWAMYTKARQEKALARQLAKLQIPFYLPLVPQIQAIRQRKTRSYLPLFSGYLFLFGSDTERGNAFTTNRIVSVLQVKDQIQLARDLAQCKRLIDTDASLKAERRLMPGRSVRVKHGALEGLEGIITRHHNRSRLLVAVQMMRQGVSVLIEECMVEPID